MSCSWRDIFLIFFGDRSDRGHINNLRKACIFLLILPYSQLTTLTGSMLLIYFRRCCKPPNITTIKLSNKKTKDALLHDTMSFNRILF